MLVGRLVQCKKDMEGSEHHDLQPRSLDGCLFVCLFVFGTGLLTADVL